MTPDEYKALYEELTKLRQEVGWLTNNWDKDRQDYSDVKVRLGKMEAGNQELRSIVISLPRQIGDAMEEAVKPLIQGIKDLNNTIEHKRTLPITPTNKQWWKFWKRGA